MRSVYHAGHVILSIKVLVDSSYVLHRSQVCDNYTVLLILLPAGFTMGGPTGYTGTYLTLLRFGEQTVKIRTSRSWVSEKTSYEDAQHKPGTIPGSQAAMMNFRLSV